MQILEHERWKEDLSYWTWGRYPTTQGATCFYDATRLDGTELASGFSFDINGNAEVIALPPKTSMKRSLWAVRRETRSDQGTRRPTSTKYAGRTVLFSFCSENDVGMERNRCRHT